MQDEQEMPINECTLVAVVQLSLRLSPYPWLCVSSSGLDEASKRPELISLWALST